MAAAHIKDLARAKQNNERQGQTRVKKCTRARLRTYTMRVKIDLDSLMSKDDARRLKDADPRYWDVDLQYFQIKLAWDYMHAEAAPEAARVRREVVAKLSSFNPSYTGPRDDKWIRRCLLCAGPIERNFYLTRPSTRGLKTELMEAAETQLDAMKDEGFIRESLTYDIVIRNYGILVNRAGKLRQRVAIGMTKKLYTQVVGHLTSHLPERGLIEEIFARAII